MKHNPLFVDSTKFHGDVINTQIELRRILIYDDEKLFVVVTTPQGDSKRTRMNLNGEENFSACVHLHHQTLISYRFEIEKEGRTFLFSRGFKARAQYALITDWEPSDEDPATLQATPAAVSPAVNARPRPAAADREPWPRAQVASIRSMMDKFGF